MGSSTCATVSKCLLVLTNILFFLSGAILLALGILLKVDYESLLGHFDTIPTVQSLVDLLNAVKDNFGDYNSSLTKILGNIGWVLIGVGAFFFILGFLGMCGACKESKLMLRVYAVIVFVILAAEVGFVIYLAVNFDKIEEDILKILNKSLEKYTGISVAYNTSIPLQDQVPELNLDTDAVSMAWDTIQITLKCCGVHNYTSYDTYNMWEDAYNGTTLQPTAPVSCCAALSLDHFPHNLDQVNQDEMRTCLIGTDDAEIHQKGCYQKVKEMIDRNLYIIIGVFSGIVAFEILCIVAACCLSSKSDKD